MLVILTRSALKGVNFLDKMGVVVGFGQMTPES